MKKKARVIAYYLPQFHPVPENDETWGKGFTEWTNVAQAKPQFKGHHQPRIPADLGFYDLRLPEVREAQAELAREAGVEGFMYWHYWFGEGKMLLEKPLEWVLETGKPDFPFCFGWANHSWSTKTWTKKKGMLDKPKMIAEQKYLGEEDNRLHFEYCLKFFKDPRYITVEGKPLFVIYNYATFEGLKEFIAQWNQLAIENGLKGIYFMGQWKNEEPMEEIMSYGFDGVIRSGRLMAEQKLAGSEFKKHVRDVLAKRFGIPAKMYDYTKITENMIFEDVKVENCYPLVCPGFDRTAREGTRAQIYTNPTPQAFQKSVHKNLELIAEKDFEHKLLFLDSWNEWGEGNYMEPDLKWGHAYLEALKAEIVEP